MFHLVFLRALVAKGEDKGLIALKGGCNLRFYYGSVRYSEDIDFDVVVVAPGTLRNRVDRLLRSPLVTAPLKTHGIRLTDIAAPKQTATTQRWKVRLELQPTSLPLRTKIEFSRRGAIAGTAFESVDREVLRPYGLSSVLATHYSIAAAIEQKVQALAGRAEPQPRDVFDLHLLLARARDERANPRLAGSRLSEAIDRAMSISYDDYRSKVLAYLDPDQAVIYETRAAWAAMQSDVISELEGLR